MERAVIITACFCDRFVAFKAIGEKYHNRGGDTAEWLFFLIWLLICKVIFLTCCRMSGTAVFSQRTPFKLLPVVKMRSFVSPLLFLTAPIAASASMPRCNSSGVI